MGYIINGNLEEVTWNDIIFGTDNVDINHHVTQTYSEETRKTKDFGLPEENLKNQDEILEEIRDLLQLLINDGIRETEEKDSLEVN